MAKIPDDRFYSEQHLWIKKERKDLAKIGITEYYTLKNEEILDIELPTEEEEFEKGEIFGSIETTEQLYDLIAPVSGKVIAVNEKILDDVEILNEDPYNEGWLLKIKMFSPEELDELLPAEDYEIKLMEELDESISERFLEEEE